MCGIFGFIDDASLSTEQLNLLKTFAMKCQHRGPDNTQEKLINNNIYLVFHRLMINDISERGNQPISHPSDNSLTLICNGEIYNYKELAEDNDFKMKSSSDCEIILHMYKKYGIEHTVKNLDGVFAFILVDETLNRVWAARDPIGVRSMFIGETETSTCVASELKSITNSKISLVNNIRQFPPGHYCDLMEHQGKTFVKYYEYSYPTNLDTDPDVIMSNIKRLLIKATGKRLLSERKIGCLLSGGLDSSLIAGILCEFYEPSELSTFSIGLEGSVDLKYARIVADYLGTDHHEVIVTEEEMLNTLEEDIQMIESYDTTTVRASTPMYILSKYIRDNTDVVVIFSGEGSDESSGSYMYFHNAPDATEFKKETVRLMEDLCYFDVLRCDKSTAGAGLEVRVPFLDKEFLQYYLSIKPELKMPKTFKIEKYLLRKAFESAAIIPTEVLWRKKEGMSDGVSSEKKAWFEIIQNKVSKHISDREFSILSGKYSHCIPQIKESLYYREVFCENYENCDTTIPYYWLPKWSGDITEPSARVLNCYDNEAEK
uniref:asparagine synthase (glutamine-hydrolyzing) n=1 Tax=viral metagenome TaxID=1070528 RepID=A0A6C0B5F4_9ZZZZ